MQPAEPGHGRTLRLALVTLVLVVLLLLIAYTSRSGFGHGSQAQPTPGYVDWAVSVFLVLFVLMIPVAVYAYTVQMREFRAQRERRSYSSRVLRGLAVIFALMLVGFVIAYLRKHGLQLVSLRNLVGGAQGAGRNAHGTLKATPYNPSFQWPVLWVTLALFAIGGVIWWRWRGAAQPVAEWSSPDDSIADDVAASITDALDDLEAEPDARRAVIAAYARMERVLARHGLRRQASETPVEYLRRILLGLTARTDAVTRLTGLFEQAKFSRHAIDAAMKQDAIDSLRAIRDDLQRATA